MNGTSNRRLKFSKHWKVEVGNISMFERGGMGYAKYSAATYIY